MGKHKQDGTMNINKLSTSTEGMPTKACARSGTSILRIFSARLAASRRAGDICAMTDFLSIADSTLSASVHLSSQHMSQHIFSGPGERKADKRREREETDLRGDQY